MQSLLMQIDIFGSACVFTLEFMGNTKAKCRNEAILASSMHELSSDVLHMWMPNRMKTIKIEADRNQFMHIRP